MSLSGNGAVTLYLDRLSEIPAKRPIPVENLVQYKQLTQRESHHRSYSTARTTDEGTLATQVLRECQKNQNLLRFLQNHQANAPAETPTSSRQKKNSKKKAPVSNSSASSSPESTPVKKTQSSQKEIQAQGSIQDQLLQQLREQRALQKQLELVATQVLKVQAGTHLHPLLSSQA